MPVGGGSSKSPQRMQDLKPVLTLNLTGGQGGPSTTKNNNNNQLGSLN